MDFSEVKHSGGKVVPHSDLRVGTISRVPLERNLKLKDLEIMTRNIRSHNKLGGFQDLLNKIRNCKMDVGALPRN